MYICNSQPEWLPASDLLPMVFGKVGGDEDRLGLPPPQCLRVHHDAPAPGLHQTTGAVDLRLLKSFNLLVSQKHQLVCSPFSAK